jgi:VWFA-related protein
MIAQCHRRMSWCLLALLLITSAVGLAQQASGTASPNEQSRSITLDVVVTDKAGTPQRGLQQQEFTLLDNKQRRELTSFRAVDVEARTPAPYIEVVLVIDAINADLFHATMEREGIKNFLQSNGGKLAQPVSLVLVSDNPTQMRSKPSTDGNALAAQLDQYETGLRTINRSQGIYGVAERFQMSMQALTSLADYEAARSGRKLVLWISPGWPLLQGVATDITVQDQRHIFQSIVALSTRLRQDHIALYNVETRGLAGTSLSQFFNYQEFVKGVKSVDEAYPPTLSLQVLAVQTGGLVLNRSNDLPSAIAAEIAKSAADAGVFYVLSFAADRADRADEYHSLEVKVAKPGLIARTRTGYYAQP